MVVLSATSPWGDPDHPDRLPSVELHTNDWVGRVHEGAWGALNPPTRHGTPHEGWGRFDVPGQTVYVGDVRACLVETLAYARPDPALAAITNGSSVNDALADLLDPDDDGTPVDVYAPWATAGHAPPGSLPDTWLAARRVTTVVPTRPLVLCPITTADAIAVARRTLPTWAPHDHPLRADPHRLSVEHLTGPDRALTCALAAWVRHQVDAFDRPLDGITTISKHGTDLTTHAIWLPGPDSDTPPPLFQHASSELTLDGPHGIDIRAACAIVGLRTPT